MLLLLLMVVPINKYVLRIINISSLMVISMPLNIVLWDFPYFLPLTPMKE